MTINIMYYMIITAIHVRSLLVVSLMESHEERILGRCLLPEP